MVNENIRRLRNSISGELSQDKLESVVKECGALCQDGPQVLVFFVLQNVCSHLAAALDGEAVSFEKFNELTCNVSDQIDDILRDVEEGEQVPCGKLEALVATFIKNLGIYRS